MIKAPFKIQPTKINFVNEFVAFIQKYGVIGLAIGVVVGQATNRLVTSLVSNLIDPLLGKIIGKVNLKEWVVQGFGIGPFIADLINFILVMLIVYLAIRFFVQHFMTEEEKEKFEFLKKKQAAEDQAQSESKPAQKS